MIGSAVVREAVRRGFKVVCIVRENSARIGNIHGSKNIRVLECNAERYKSMEIPDKYDVFIHLAWDKTSLAGRDDVDCQMRNIGLTLDAVRLAARCGCKVFVGAGSQAEYGIQEVDLSENLPVQPESGYGIAKYTAGKFSAMLCSNLGLRFCWLRILSVYGINDGANTLISYCINELRAGRTPELTKCEQIWDYLHCDDAARAVLSVAERGRDGAFYPLGSGKGQKLSEYIKIIRDILAPGAELGFGKKEYYPHQPMHLVADISSLTRDTLWKPQISFRDGISELVSK